MGIGFITDIQIKQKKRYLDDAGTEVKPKNLLQRRSIYTPSNYPIQQMWDRDRKITRGIIGRKGKPSRFIYLPGTKSLRLKVI